MNMLEEIWNYFQTQNNREIFAFFAGGLLVVFSWAIWVSGRFAKYIKRKEESKSGGGEFQFKDGDLKYFKPKLIREYVYKNYGFSMFSGEPNLGYLVIVYGGYETHREKANDMDIIVLVDKHVQNPDDLPEQKVYFNNDGFVELSDYHFLKFWRNLVIGMPHAISVVIDGRVIENHNMSSLEFDYLRSMAKDLTYHSKYISNVILTDIQIYSELRDQAIVEDNQTLLAQIIYMEASCWVQRLALNMLPEKVSWEEIYPLSKPVFMKEKLEKHDCKLAETYLRFRDIQKNREENPGIADLKASFHEFEKEIRDILGARNV